MLKSVFIICNQALGEEVLKVLNDLQIRGFTKFNSLQGRGSETGEPHMGSHSWPALNEGVMTVVPEEKVEMLLEKIRDLNNQAEDQGIRAFVWNVERMI